MVRPSMDVPTEDLRIDLVASRLPVIVGRPDGDVAAIADPTPKATDASATQTTTKARRLPPGEGPRLGSYQLAGRFSSSELFRVFLARRASHLGITKPVVLKVASREDAAYLQNRQILIDEYRAMAQLDHPNIVAVLDAGEIDAGSFVALEYVDGIDARGILYVAIVTKKPPPVGVACYILINLLRGLEHAHTARGFDDRPLGIIHRDVSPANVLVSKEGEVKLTDFGVVKMRGRVAQDTLPGMVKGKPAYLPPEYIAGEAIDHRVDVYSAGVLLFELLLGERCFVGSGADVFKDVMKGVDVARLSRAGLDAELVEIVARATQKEPGRRFSTAAQMGLAIEDWLKNRGIYVSQTALVAEVRVVLDQHARGLDIPSLAKDP